MRLPVVAAALLTLPVPAQADIQCVFPVTCDMEKMRCVPTPARVIRLVRNAGGWDLAEIPSGIRGSARANPDVQPPVGRTFQMVAQRDNQVFVGQLSISHAGSTEGREQHGDQARYTLHSMGPGPTSQTGLGSCREDDK